MKDLQQAKPAGVVDGVLYCYGACGMKYSDFPLDLIVPTPIWNEIATGAPFDETQPNVDREGRGGVLCAACMVARLSKLPGVTVALLSVDRDSDEDEATRLNQRAMTYMAECMAMRQPLNDQEQNWILGHLVTFACQEAERKR